jgi:RNA polymerase sporulation-specific sigma factor
MKNINNLINDYKQGNKEIFNQIFKAEENQLKRLISTFYHMEKDDLYQVACIGLLKAIETFDTSKNIKFNSYMYNIVKNELIITLRTHNKKSNVDNMKISIEENTTDDLTIMDTLASNEDIEENYIIKEEYQTLYNMIDNYYNKNTMKKNVMYDILKDNKTQEEIAKDYNITRSYVAKIYHDFVKYGKSKVA